MAEPSKRRERAGPADLERYDVLILDMNETFMFGGDRFSEDENFFATYGRSTGGTLAAPAVNAAIRSTYAAMEALYFSVDRYDDFPCVADVLRQVSAVPDFEVERLTKVFAEHELGRVPPEYVRCLQRLAETHELHVLSNLWAPKTLWIDHFREVGIAGCFESLVFSSDGSSIKPSPRIFEALLSGVSPSRALMIGDSLRCDVAGAHQAGIDALWISHGQALGDAAVMPNLIARDLLQMAS